VELSPAAAFRAVHALLAFRPRLLEWSRAVVSAHATRSVASLLILTSTVALVGWAADIGWLVQPFTSFPPARLATALGMLMVGAGLFSSSFRRCEWLAIGCACIALVIGSLPLQQAQGFSAIADALGQVPPPLSVNWHGQPRTLMALSSAVFVALGGVGVLAISARRRGLWSSIILAAAGGILMLLASTVIASQAMGFLDRIEFGQVLDSAVQMTFCAIVLATHFSALGWSKQAGFSPPPAWLPLSVGAGSLLTVLFVWRAMLSSEESRLIEQSRVAALATRSSVNRQLLVAQRNLRRMARYGWALDSTWSEAATQMVDDVEGLEALVWADGNGHSRASDRHTSPSAVASIEASLRIRLAVLRRPTDGGWFVPVTGDPTRTMMVVPRCAADRCTDLFVGVINSAGVLGAVLSDTVLGFEMAIGDSSRWFRSSAPLPTLNPQRLMRQTLLSNGPNWQLGVWPSLRTATVTPSTLSDLVLLLGLAVSVLLTIALRLAQSLTQLARLEERDRINHALQSTTDGLWEWDLRTGCVVRSPVLWARLGYGTRTPPLRMQDWLALVHPLDVSRVELRLKDHLESRSEAFDAQYRVRSAAGRWHDIVDRGCVVLRSPGGTPLRLLGMFADVTDRRHAEELLRQAETMSTMGRLAARIAHEINNPLAGIQNAFLLVKDAIPPTHPHFAYVAAIEREVQRISQVTHQLYETYRPVTETSAYAPVQAVIGDAVASLAQVNRNVAVAVSVELGDVAAVVKISNSILRQCVHNLVQNAIEASPEGHRVTVSGAIVGDDFELRVRDMGPGVPLELRESIFEPFVSTKASHLFTGGMGLGLSLVRRALDAAGGSIEVADADGGGAEFIARIPLAESLVPGVTV